MMLDRAGPTAWQCRLCAVISAGCQSKSDIVDHILLPPPPPPPPACTLSWLDGLARRPLYADI